MSNRLAIILSLAMAVLLIAGCGTSKPASSAPPQVSVFESSSQAVEKQPAVDPEIEKQKQEEEQGTEQLTPPDGTEFIPKDTGVEFTTPYKTLLYPKELQGKVTIDHLNEEGKYSVVFNEKESGVMLFSVTFAKNDAAVEGYVIGTLTHETEGDIKVCVNVNEQTPEQWSEQQYNDFCAMQERINDLMVQFYEDERFDTGR